MKKIISIVSLLVAVASSVFVGVAISGNSESKSFSPPSTSIYEANSNFDLNSATTDNVYQQIVVAGWGIKDMTEVVAAEVVTLRFRMDALVEAQSLLVILLSVAILLLSLITAILAMGNFARHGQKDEPSVIASSSTLDPDLGPTIPPRNR